MDFVWMCLEAAFLMFFFDLAGERYVQTEGQ